MDTTHLTGSARPTVAYAGTPLDRASAQRIDPDWIEAVRRRPGSRVLPLWRNRCLLDAAGPIRRPTVDADGLAATPWVFLGLDGDAGVFAADLSEHAEADALRLAGADAAQDVRRLVGTLDASTAATLAYARGLLLWHRNQRFCGRCGAPADADPGGNLRICTATDCGRLLFPRIEPAVITLVTAPDDTDRCLLGRPVGADADGFSTLAGFVEIGESLEDAVRREIVEETGVPVDSVTYQASQPWPFPSGLMVGFRARAVTEECTVDGVEMAEARWFSRAELRDRARTRPIFRDDSIERFLLTSWLAESP